MIHPYSTVKNYLKSCLTCKRVNARPVKLNQNAYREFRTNPPCEPYKFIYIDYIGPFKIRINGVLNKCWLLAITCLWSRAVNLKICSDFSVKTFLREFQIHIFEHGLPARVTSDLGSQLVAGANLISDHLNSVESRNYLAEHGIQKVSFEQYFKGDSSLGSLVESCVKLVKRLIYGSIKRNVLSSEDFKFTVAQTINLVNKRVIAYSEALRDEDGRDLPAPITPEILVTGRELTSPNVIPALELGDEEWVPSSSTLSQSFSKLRKIRTNLVHLYNKEFLKTLSVQATNKIDRFKPVPHGGITVGDVVLLKEPHMKAPDYPMAVVRECITNSLGEVTDIVAKKGRSNEIVKRHVTSVIPLLKGPNINSSSGQQNANTLSSRPVRAAAVRSRHLTQTML